MNLFSAKKKQWATPICSHAETDLKTNDYPMNNLI